MLSSLGLLVAGATAITYFTAVDCMPVIPFIPAVAGLPAKKFLGFLHISLPHESFTQPLGPFRFWFEFHGDIHNLKMTP